MKKIAWFLFGAVSLILIGAGGRQYLDSAVLDSYLDIKESAAPSTPASAYGVRFYEDSTTHALQYSANGQAFSNFYGKMNFIINGDSQVMQRGGFGGSNWSTNITSFGNPGAGTTDAYQVDRWKFASAANTIAICTRYATSCTVALKQLTTNVVTLTLAGTNEIDLVNNENVTVSLNPADAVFDGTYQVTGSGTGGSRSTSFTYAQTHANVGSTATGGNFYEQNLNASSYMTVRSSGTNKVAVFQVLEMHRLPEIRGHTVITQFKMKGNASSNHIRAALVQLGTNATSASDYDLQLPATLISAYGANGTDPTYSTTSSYHVISNIAVNTTNGSTVNSQAEFTPAADWTACWFTTVLPKNYENLMLIFWTNNAPAANDFFSLSEVGVYDDSTLQPYNPRPTAQELILAQRYCFVLTAPGNGNNNVMVSGVMNTATSMVGVFNFPVVMRIAPSFSVGGSFTASHVGIFDGVNSASLSTNPTIPGTWSASATQLMLTLTASGLAASAANRGAVGYYTTSGTSADQFIFNADY